MELFYCINGISFVSYNRFQIEEPQYTEQNIDNHRIGTYKILFHFTTMSQIGKPAKNKHKIESVYSKHVQYLFRMLQLLDLLSFDNISKYSMVFFPFLVIFGSVFFFACFFSFSFCVEIHMVVDTARLTFSWNSRNWDSPALKPPKIFVHIRH